MNNQRFIDKIKLKYQNITKYFEFFKIGLKNIFEYKANLYSSLLSPIIMIFIYSIIWQYIYFMKSNGNSNYLIGGFKYSEMLIYIMITQLTSVFKDFSFSEDIATNIKTGNIVIYLTRPIDFVKSLFYKKLGNMSLNIIIYISILTTLSYIFKLYIPTKIDIFFSLIYGILLLLFYILLSIILGGLSFWLTEIWGIRFSIQKIIWIFSGNAIPLSLFPKLLIDFLKWTPFFYLDYTFAKIYLGKLTITTILKNISIFMTWILILLISIKILYKIGFKKLVSFGG